APSNLTAAATSTSQVSLSWGAVSGATAYAVQRSPDGSTGWATVAPSLTAPTYTDTGLAAGTKYYYRVQASNTAGDSAYSSTASATTQAAATQVQLVTDPNKVFSVPSVSKPAYLTPVTDPNFGTQVTRIAGDPGTTLTAANGTGKWSYDARHWYSKDQPWNADGSLIAIENQTDGGGTPDELFLDGSTYQVKYVKPSNLPSRTYG